MCPCPEVSSQLAVIHEDACIGCTKCIQACPVDAIVGAAKYMHTVLTDICIGCGLCVPPCPVDCIDLVPIAPLSILQAEQKILSAKNHFDARNARVEKNSRLKNKKRLQSTGTPPISSHAIHAAVARVLAKRIKK
jgi:electron transport complex protein RnfB